MTYAIQPEDRERLHALYLDFVAIGWPHYAAMELAILHLELSK